MFNTQGKTASREPVTLRYHHSPFTLFALRFNNRLFINTTNNNNFHPVWNKAKSLKYANKKLNYAIYGPISWSSINNSVVEVNYKLNVHLNKDLAFVNFENIQAILVNGVNVYGVPIMAAKRPQTLKPNYLITVLKGCESDDENYTEFPRTESLTTKKTAETEYNFEDHILKEKVWQPHCWVLKVS